MEFFVTESDSRLTTPEFHRLERGRSGSPSEYYRKHIQMQGQIDDKVHELNVFIHRGIEKFLDKQAVRDLIHQYDHEDIFIGGEEQFFKTLIVEMEEERNVKTGVQLVNQSFKTMAEKQAQKRKLQKEMSRESKRGRSAATVIKHFVSLVFVKVFGIRVTPFNTRQQRVDSEIFEAHNP